MKILDKTYRWELNARYNYWTELNTWKFLSIIMFPHLVVLVGVAITKNTWFLIGFAVWMPLFITTLLLRENNVMDKLRYDMEDNSVREYFSSKWLKRGTHQYVYITPHPNGVHSAIHSYEPIPSPLKLMMFGPDESAYHKFEKEALYKWNWDCTRLANQKEIDENSLQALEAKILLNKDN